MTAQTTGPAAINRAGRRLEALELRKAGATYRTIAERLKYPNPANAYRDVTAAIKAITADAAAEVVQLEVERLDAMLLGVWASARVGNQGAIDRVLRIMERRARLLGLDQPAKTELDLGTAPVTVMFNAALAPVAAAQPDARA